MRAREQNISELTVMHWRIASAEWAFVGYTNAELNLCCEQNSSEFISHTPDIILISRKSNQASRPRDIPFSLWKTLLSTQCWFWNTVKRLAQDKRETRRQQLKTAVTSIHHLLIIQSPLIRWAVASGGAWSQGGTIGVISGSGGNS